MSTDNFVENEITLDMPLPSMETGDPFMLAQLNQLQTLSRNLGNISAKARIYKSAAQSIASPTKIQLDIETYDQAGNFDNVTNYRFTAKVAGFYLINAQVGMTSVPAGQGVASYIYKNGNEHSYNISYFNGPAGNSCKSTIVDLVKLDVDDYIELFAANTEAPTTRALETGESKTFMTIHFLSII